LMFVFAYMDYKQVITIRGMQDENKWDIYWQEQQPATVFMWAMVFVGIAFIWYLFSKDQSEALALGITALTLLWFGVQDVMYFMFDKVSFVDNMCWADVITPVRVISNFLGETCPSRMAFIISAVIGILLASYVYKNLQEAKW